MKCPFCASQQNRVIDSRLSKDGNVIRRRRECDGCGRRFTTYERVEEIMPMVIKKDGNRVSYDRQKILSGLRKACEKRPVPVSKIEALVDDLERELQDAGEKEVLSSYIGERLMDRLRDVDPVAYVRFASVYRSFRDVNEFFDELKHLLTQRESDGRSGASR
ncbi:MAG: transcriptional repressor NrdR [Deltaproteobacteria bacterium]|nr:transcriptional repressor NrdR [Deltaproteobacteria bacterium]